MIKNKLNYWRKKPYNKNFSKLMYAKFKVFRKFRPLAHDIHIQLFNTLPYTSRNQIRAFLFYHCRIVKYHKNAIQRGYRKNLDFSRSQMLTSDDKNYHKQRLIKINRSKVE